MNLRWHRSSVPFAGRIICFMLVCSLVVAAVTYGFVSPDSQIETSADATTPTSVQATTTTPGREQRAKTVIPADDIKSIGPSGTDASRSTSTTTADSSTPSTTVPATLEASTPETTTISGPGVTQFVLIDARNGAVLMPLQSGSVIDRNQFRDASLSIEAYGTGSTESVRFWLNGNRLRLENVAPYELNGQSKWLQEAGSYSLAAEAYSHDDAQGIASSRFTIQLTVK